jgi:hypothetical protein
LKYPPFPWAQHFQDGAHQTTGAQRKIFEKGTIFFGHSVLLRRYLQHGVLFFSVLVLCKSQIALSGGGNFLNYV